MASRQTRRDDLPNMHGVRLLLLSFLWESLWGSTSCLRDLVISINFPPLPPFSFLQHEKSPSPVISRTRGGDSTSSSERPDAEAASPTTRSRPVTRSMGQGEVCGLGTEVPSSPHRKAKRPRLCSSSSSDSSARAFFDPLAQHRDWCPWVNEVKEAVALGAGGDRLEGKADLGWQAVLKVLQASRQSETPAHLESESSPHP
ncbi:nuclear-interacting partner of ALK-like isoform X2 [Python bivittatus]|uniref:Nuclear-interacting partner of ALK-like isoform X2 n=1 Tax=Python bivittatus TaxID=176946 RepID=A0A9F5JCQ8_PYTBI|nr:nuclear-interacting partner of ALK-like isoform X2 [Python bivittatus]